MTLGAIDLAVTRWVNSMVGRSAVLDAVFVFLSVWLIVGVAVGALAVLVQRESLRRAMLVLEMVGTLVIALFVSQVIGVVAFRERPFVRHDVRQLIAMDAREKSFPSGHATAAFALAIPAAAALRRRWVSVTLLGGASAVAIGRVLVGVHYVSDMLAGVLLAWVVWWFVHRAIKRKYASLGATTSANTCITSRGVQR